MRRTRVLCWLAISVLFAQPALTAPQAGQQAPEFRVQDRG